MTFVLPGDIVPMDSNAASSSSSAMFGPGLAPFSQTSNGSKEEVQGGRVVVTKPGILQSRQERKGKSKAPDVVGELRKSYWVEGMSKRYIPATRDLVLGTIIARHSEGYRVDIGSSSMATLDALAFEGATKRSKPNLKIGTLVYARVSSSTRDMDPELECFEPSTGKSDGFGELKGGLVVPCSLELCRQLLTPKHPLCPALASVIPFEIAIGLNGRVWFKAGSVSETIALKRVVEAVDDGSIGLGKGEVEKAAREFMA